MIARGVAIEAFGSYPANGASPALLIAVAHEKAAGFASLYVALRHGNGLDVRRAADADYSGNVDSSHFRDIEGVCRNVLQLARKSLDIVESSRNGADRRAAGADGCDQL